MTDCPPCKQGPSGIEGHPDLYAHAMGGGQMRFKCSTCGHVWTRHYVGDGSFAWEQPAAGEHPGMEVPRR